MIRQAKDLMLNDWVNMRINSSSQWFPLQVKSISPDNGLVYNDIAITKEMLEKNGFTKVNSQKYIYVISGSRFYISVNPYKNILNVIGANGSKVHLHPIITSLKVHQLQHALKLVGWSSLAEKFII